MSYVRLDDTTSEIRLLTLLPRSFDHEVVRCRLETHSLAQLTRPYLDFLASPKNAHLSRRKAIREWLKLHCGSDVNHRVYHENPPSQFYRYVWGDYAALSYAWGDETQLATIRINGRPSRVTQNLERALRAFRDQEEFRSDMKLWVDAICINQDDLEERSQQIKRMRDIYGGALSVVSWLGTESGDSNTALDLLHNLAGFRRMNRGKELEKLLVENPGYLGTGCWLALERLMERTYWYRLWAIQEIVMGASSVTLRCGLSSIDWTSFADGVHLLQEHLWLVKDTLLFRDMQERKIKVQAWATKSLHLVYQDLATLCKREEESQSRLDFGRILDIAVTSNCKDPRDKVYGLIGLMESRIAAQLKPDYSLGPANVFAAAAKAFIQGYQNLEPLREGNPWGPTGCPSWSADWQWSGRVRWARIENQLDPPGWLSGFFPGTSDADGSDQRSVASPYHASRDTPYQVCFSSDGLILTCGGFVVDSISSLSAREFGYWRWDESSIDQTHPFKNMYGDNGQLTQALCRTLLLDRVWRGEKAGSRHSAVFHLPSTFTAAGPQFQGLGWDWLASQQHYYFRYREWRKANRHFWIGERMLDDFFTNDIPKNASEYDTTEAYTCFDRTCKKRRLMTTERGYIGWAPDDMYGTDIEQTRHGDLIAILFGCSTPIVVRPKGSHFQVLGEAYVHGMMEGEAMDFLEDGRAQHQTFTFC